MPHIDMINHLSNNLFVSISQRNLSSLLAGMLTVLAACRLAGSDTTGISLRAIIYYLVKTPRAYKKLQDEIDAADRDGKLSSNVTYAECLELPYL